MKVGNNEVKDILIGDTQVLKVYRGEDVVWERQVSPLPSGYTEVKYIEASGKQYTIIDYKPSLATEIECEFIPGKQTQTYPALVAAVQGGTSARAMAIMFGSSVMNIKFATDSAVFASSLSMAVGQMHTIYLKRGLLIYDNVNYPYTAQETGLTDNTFGIFCRNGIGPLLGVTLAVAKLYKLNFSENGVLMSNLIPCLDNNNVPCFYDTVSGNTFYNAGTGTFGYETMDGTVVAPT